MSLSKKWRRGEDMDWSKAGLCWHPAHKDIKIEHPHVIGRSPVRLELAGGWSDTPPYCQDLGGTVLNAAISINGKKPILVELSKLKKPMLVVSSGDYTIPIHHMDTLLDYTNLQDPSSIVKAALIGGGIIKHDHLLHLHTLLESFGGGLKVKLDVSLPYGSGLGVSSIIVATIISCLSGMFGLTYSGDEVSNRTIYAEQLMGTVGGWQDQLGGCTPGLKLISSNPGVYQKCVTHNIPVDQDLWERCVLYYTGYTRIAKEILGDIMIRYNPYTESRMESLIKHNECLAHEMYGALQKKQYKAFNYALEMVWNVHKELHPAISTERTEKIEQSIEHLTQTTRIIGSGNGGFMLIVAKQVSDIPSIKRTILEKCPQETAEFVDFAIDEEGLQVEVEP
jgi:galactokinase/mevalonate kinase-like predicted kinase